MAKTYTCPFCIPRKKFNRHKLPGHIAKYHEDDIPENLTPYRFAYDIINNHPDHKGNYNV